MNHLLKSNVLLLLVLVLFPPLDTERMWMANGFVENTIDRFIYMKVSGRIFVILILYVGDIFLVANDVAMLHNVKKYLSNNFEMKDMGKASYVIGIEIFCEKSQGLLGLSQKG